MPKLTDAPFRFRVALGAMRVNRAIARMPTQTTSPIGIAATHAIQQACANPGCLVRVYFRSIDEAGQLLDRVYGGLAQINQIDLRRTKAGLKGSAPVIELFNGSGIELLPDPDVADGAGRVPRG
jgi:hypothetical protein